MFGKIRNLVNEISARLSAAYTIAMWDVQEMVEARLAAR
jgi:hypothetical protein